MIREGAGGENVQNVMKRGSGAAAWEFEPTAVAVAAALLDAMHSARVFSTEFRRGGEAGAIS